MARSPTPNSVRTGTRHNLPVRIDDDQFNGVRWRARAHHVGGQTVNLGEGVCGRIVIADDGGLAGLILAVESERYHGRVPKIPMLQERNVRQGFFDDAMVEAVLAKLPAPLRSVVQFAYVTGWRVQSEVLPIEWRHVDREAREVRLEPGTTKNAAGRVFPFTEALKTLFDGLWAEHEGLKTRGTICRFVFHRNGKRMRTLKGAWAIACRDAGHPGMLLHDLRRSAVRNMERAGLSRSVAMQLTGHRTEAVYRRYAITSEADLREGVERLDGTRSKTNRQSA